MPSLERRNSFTTPVASSTWLPIRVALFVRPEPIQTMENCSSWKMQEITQQHILTMDLDRDFETTYADASFEGNTSYDANSNVLTYVTRSGASITNTYDPLNRLSTKAPQGQSTVTYLYDLSGRLLSSTTPVVGGNPASGQFAFSYDTAGRLIQEETPDSKTVIYGLDNGGNVTKLTYPDAYYVTRVYDQLNRLTDVKLNGATTSAINITYDELSRRAVLNDCKRRDVDLHLPIE